MIEKIIDECLHLCNQYNFGVNLLCTIFAVNCCEVFIIVQSSSFFNAALAQKQSILYDARYSCAT